jgi:hypothetical protein
MTKEMVLTVLHRAAEDLSFYARLAHQPWDLIGEYDLTREELLAIATADVRWLEQHVGKLNGRLMEKVLIPLLSREQW